MRSKLKTQKKNVLSGARRNLVVNNVKWSFVKRIELEKNIYLGVFNREKVLVAVF